LKYKLHSGVIASQSVNQSMNIRLITKRNKSIFLDLVLVLHVWLSQFNVW